MVPDSPSLTSLLVRYTYKTLGNISILWTPRKGVKGKFYCKILKVFRNKQDRCNNYK